MSDSRPSRGRVTGLAGVLIWTEQFEPMLAFYRDVLGLTPRSVKPDQGFVNFEWGDVRLSIGLHSEVIGPARDPLRVMVNLRVDDLDAAYERLLTAGVVFLRPPADEPWGRLATLTDPDGNVLQLFEFPGD